MKGFTTLERVIIDSIHKRKSTIPEMKEDTGIDLHIINNILQALILKGLVQQKHSEYSLTSHLPVKVVDHLNSFEAKKFEAQDLLNQIIQPENSSNVKVKKYFLNEKDNKILQALLINLETFLDEATKTNKQIKSRDMNVMFWATGNYSDVIQNCLT
jgi:hypothetical protein